MRIDDLDQLRIQTESEPEYFKSELEFFESVTD
jgi:hypothetical protein